MFIGSMRIALYAPWVHSLKEKRMIVRSLTAKTRNTFNVSIAEVDEQDVHQTVVLGIACVAGTVSLTNSMLDSVLNYIEGNTDAQVTDIQREIL